ncbi:MAG: (E)-4-hydroxy-3-methylbut-2-enyl-diphosphate synthase, partial [Bacteroidales bacterium]|nr:(E)-4-hydroxy-3-methylbut-2-enyl-diphosphate synthase [Bacteroidales bacterium]
MIEEDSKVVFVGDIPIGGNYPVVVQSMTNTATQDIKKTLNQIISIRNTGANFVRITIPNAKDLAAAKEIKAILKGRGLDIPLVADIHFSPKLAIQAASVVEKVRINPGNFAELSDQASEIEQRAFIKSKLTEFITVCKQYHTSVRIGVNHGSLSERMLRKYGDTPEGMVASVMEYLEIFQELEFDRIIISLKSSNPLVMIYANRLLKRKMDEAGVSFPLHLGVTEAGDGEDGRVKSTIGIGTLLIEGLGDTIRVSLTEPPENEIPVAKKNIQYAGEIS